MVISAIQGNSAILPRFSRSNRRCLGGALVLAALCAVQFNASAGNAPLPGGGAKILIDFTNPQQNKFVFIGALPAMPNLILTNMSVNVNLGGVQRSYILSPEGEGVGTPDLFLLRDTGNGFVFIVSAQDNSLAAVYNQFGLINQTSNNAPIALPASITFNNQTFSTQLMGGYYATANSTGKGFLGVIQAPKDPFKVITHIATLAASPNPTQINKAVTIKGDVSLTNFTGNVSGTVHFGDMSPPIHADGSTFQKMLKDGVTHTYTTEGVFVARVALIGGDEVADTRLFIIVGDGFVVNSATGAIGRLVKSPGGSVSLQVGLFNVPGGMNAQTQFKDMKGNIAGMPPTGAPPPNGQMGLAPANTFTLPGIFVAETTTLDQGGNSLGKLRKSIVISSADVAASVVANTAGEQQAAPRDTTTDSTITLTSMAGKFLFSSTNADKVLFNGTITLPAGYTPKDPAGNDLTIGLGNVVDTIHLDSKGKLTLPTTDGYITKFKLTVPKLTNGVAVGTEIAKVSITMNVAGLIIKGFDSEGIETTARADEVGQTSVARFIQVDMLIGGQTYSALAQVSYSTSSNDDFGSISGRSAK